jgi:hypothetical protein
MGPNLGKCLKGWECVEAGWAVPRDRVGYELSGLKEAHLSSCTQDPRVLDAMLPYLINYYGNPHSRTHAYGWESEAAMEHAREVSVEV